MAWEKASLSGHFGSSIQFLIFVLFTSHGDGVMWSRGRVLALFGIELFIFCWQYVCAVYEYIFRSKQFILIMI